jgi:hypothetical protein
MGINDYGICDHCSMIDDEITDLNIKGFGNSHICSCCFKHIIRHLSEEKFKSRQEFLDFIYSEEYEFTPDEELICESIKRLQKKIDDYEQQKLELQKLLK